jgi:hypothetical protein
MTEDQAWIVITLLAAQWIALIGILLNIGKR